MTMRSTVSADHGREAARTQVPNVTSRATPAAATFGRCTVRALIVGFPYGSRTPPETGDMEEASKASPWVSTDYRSATRRARIRRRLPGRFRRLVRGAHGDELARHLVTEAERRARRPRHPTARTEAHAPDVRPVQAVEVLDDHRARVVNGDADVLARDTCLVDDDVTPR